MATLTWRNVDAPDFRGSLDGYKTAGDLLTKATTGLGRGLDSYQDFRTEAADKQAAMAGLAYTDPASYQEALASGRLTQGINPQDMSKAGIASLGNRAGVLLDQATNQLAFTKGTTDFARSQESNGLLDANREGINAYLAASRTGDARAMQDVMQKFPGLMNLTAPQFKTLVTDSQAFEDKTVNTQGSKFRLGNEVTDYEDNKAAEKLFSETKKYVIDGVSAARVVENSNLSPGARTRLEGLFSKLGIALPYGPLSANTSGGPSTPSSAGIGVSPSFISSIPIAQTRDYVANITKNAGEVTGTNEEKADKLLPHLIQQESSGNPKALGPVTKSGKQAVGLTQLMPDTARELEKKLGMKPFSTDTDPEANKLAGKAYLKQMLDESDGDVGVALAKYNAGPGNVSSWLNNNREFAQQVATNAQSLREQIQNANTQANAAALTTATARMEANTGGTAYLPKNIASTEDTQALLNAATDKGGSFEGTDKTFLRNQINKIQERTGVNPAIAMEMLQRSITTADASSPQAWAVDKFIRQVTPGSTPNLGKKSRLDDAKLEYLQLEWLAGKPLNRAMNSEIIGQQQQNIQAAQQAFNNASAAYAAILARQKINPNLPPSEVDRYKVALEEAKLVLNSVSNKTAANPNLQPQSINKLTKAQQERYKKLQAKFGSSDPVDSEDVGPPLLPQASTLQPNQFIEASRRWNDLLSGAVRRP